MSPPTALVPVSSESWATSFWKAWGSPGLTSALGAAGLAAAVGSNGAGGACRMASAFLAAASFLARSGEPAGACSTITAARTRLARWNSALCSS